MIAKSPTISKRRWQQANIYRSILIAYLFVMSLGAGVFLAQSLWHFTRPDLIVIDSPGPPPVNYILPPTALIATSALGSFLLATNMHGQFTRAILCIVLLLWSFVTLILVFVEFANYRIIEELREMLRITLPNFVFLDIVIVSNALMYVVVGELYSNRPKALSNIP